MKGIILLIIMCITAGLCYAQEGELTASPYVPSPIEKLVYAQLQGMEEADRPLAEQVNYLRDVLKDNPRETMLHRTYQNLMRRDSLEVLRNEYLTLAEQHPDNPVYAYLNTRLASTNEDRWRWAAKAVRIDPDYYWGHLAMGYHFLNLLPMPDLKQAESE